MAFIVPDNLKSRTDLPPGVVRTVGAFQIGLDENVTVWFEPLYDPTGEKPHFVVLLPEHGIAVLDVLEGEPPAPSLASADTILPALADTAGTLPQPLARAARLADTLRDRVQSDPRLLQANLVVPVEPGAVFPFLSREEAEVRGVATALSLDKAIFRGDIEAAISGYGEACLLRGFAKMLGGSLARRISRDEETILRSIIHPDIMIDSLAPPSGSIQLSLFRPRGNAEDVMAVMDRQQEAIAKSLGTGHRVIRGVAGSGKTLILVYRARLLAQCYPKHRILVTCFTHTLAGHLRALLAEYPNVNVINLDALMAKVIRAAGLRHPGYSQDESGRLSHEMALRAIETWTGPRYHHILFDEVQDFDTPSLRFVTKLLEPGFEDLVIVADAAQNIFLRQSSWKEAGIRAQGRTRILSVNYRNTREILEFATRFLFSGTTADAEAVPDPYDEKAIIRPEAAARSGPHPELIIAPDTRTEIEQVVVHAAECARRSRSPRNVAVLYARPDRGSQVDRAKEVFKNLTAAGLQVFWLRDRASREEKVAFMRTEAPIVVCSIFNAQGLEFPHVVLCGLWHGNVSVDENRMIAYSGMTRATNHLVVVGRGDTPITPDLLRAAGRAG